MMARFETLYGDHAKKIYLYCLKRVRDESVAEDLTSEAFIRLYTHLDSVRAGEELPWLCTVANHLCVDYWRKAVMERRAMEQIQTEPSAPADEVTAILMGDDVEMRKHFIQTKAKDVRFLDI